MKRARRSSRTASGRQPGSSFALAPVDRRVREAAGAVDARLSHELQEVLELGLGLAGKPAMKVLRTTSSGQISRQRCRRPGSSRRWPALHALEHVRVRVLERHVEVGQHAARRPSAAAPRRHAGTGRRSAGAPTRRALGQLAELLAQVEHARLHRLAVPEAGAVLQSTP
jgi:hypothetical protein